MIIKNWIKENQGFFTGSDLRFLLKNVSSLPKLKQAKLQYQQGKPMAYILGKEEFFGHEFKVNPDVLIPRPDTEVIVEKALDICLKEKPAKVLDLCCGSGCIGISLKKALGKKVQVWAADISPKALKIARYNAKKNQAKIKFIQSDIFSRLKGKRFGLIVCNPPYVRRALVKGSLGYEPRLALNGGNDGLNLLKKVIKQAPLYLENPGFLILEFGFDQKRAVKELIEKTCCYDIIEWIKDYAGNWRGVILAVNRR